MPWTIEEYPFASTVEGGFSSYVGEAKWDDQNAQGTALWKFKSRHGLSDGRAFLVLVIP